MPCLSSYGRLYLVGRFALRRLPILKIQELIPNACGTKLSSEVEQLRQAFDRSASDKEYFYQIGDFQPVPYRECSDDEEVSFLICGCSKAVDEYLLVANEFAKAVDRYLLVANGFSKAVDGYLLVANEFA